MRYDFTPEEPPMGAESDMIIWYSIIRLVQSFWPYCKNSLI